jgi:non-heme chloroperoxidase
VSGTTGAGTARSDAPGGGYDYDTLADDLAALLQSLDLRDVTLVGNSMGCDEIVPYLSRHGRERVALIAWVAAALPALCTTPDNPGAMDL